MQKFHILKYLLLVLFIIVAFLLGSRMILSGDFYFLYDQARDFALVKEIVLQKDIVLIGSRSGIGGFFHGPLYQYILVPIFIIGKGNPFAFTYLFLLISPLTVLIGFILMRRLYNTQVALLVAFLFSVSPRLWGFTHSVQGVNLIPLVYLFLTYFMIQFVRGNRKAFIAAAFCAGITFQFETATALILVPVMAVLYLIFGGISAVKEYKTIGLSIIAFAFSVATFILFDLKHQFLMLRSLTSVFGQNPQDGHMTIPERFTSHVSSLSGVLTSGFIQENTILILLAIGMMLTISYVLIKKQLDNQIARELLFFILMPFLFFVFYMIYAYPIYIEYVVGLTVPVIFFYGLMMFSLRKTILGKLLVIFFILVSSFHLGNMLLKQYGSPYKPDMSAGSYQNQLAVVDWVYADASGNDFGYFVYTPEVFTHGMDYLFWYRGSLHNYSPKNEKLATTYLILYPTLQHDLGGHDFWKRNTIRTNGKIISRKIFTGGIIVEKLAIPSGEEAPDPNYFQNLIFR